VVLLSLVVGIGGVVLWQKYGSDLGALSQMIASRLSTTGPATETSEAADTATPSLKDLQTSQQQMADKLEDIQRQIAAEQGERKLLSDQLAALSGRVNGLSTSNASVTTGMALQAAKKKPRLLDATGIVPRTAGANR
jgi:chromosome segregation ATPase